MMSFTVKFLIGFTQPPKKSETIFVTFSFYILSTSLYKKRFYINPKFKYCSPIYWIKILDLSFEEQLLKID